MKTERQGIYIATIGTIATNVVMKTAAFESGARKVVGTTKAMGTDVSKALASTSSSIAAAISSPTVALAAVAGAAASAYGAISSVAEAIGKIDDTGDAASALGMNVEALQAYKFAAIDAGVGANGFETAIKKMENAAADAAEGGAASKVFDKLNLDAEKFKVLAPETQLSIVADRLGDVKVQADRAQIATDLFGREGIKMLGLLEHGAKGLRDALDEGKSHFVLSKEDVATAGEADRSMKVLGETLDGIWNKLAVAVSPAIEDAAKSMTAWLVENKGLINDAIHFMGEFASGVVTVTKNVMALAGELNPVWQMVKQLHEWGWGKEGKAPGDDKAAARKHFDEQRNRINDAFSSGKIDATGRDKAFKDLFAMHANSGIITADDLKAADKSAITKEMAKQAEAIFEATRTPQEEYAKKQDDLNRLLGVGAINQDTFNRAIQAAKEDLWKAGPKFDTPTAGSIGTADVRKPRMAEPPQAFSRDAEGIAQFTKNRQAVYGDPLQKKMDARAEEQVELLRRIARATEDNGTCTAMF